MIGSRAYEQVWMDNTAPQITYVNAPDPTQWYNSGQPVQVDVQTPVGGAPIQSLTCDYSGEPVLAGGQLTEQAPAALHNWSVAVTLPGSASGALNCYGADAAGNLGPVASISQQVDMTAPTGVFVTDPTNPSVIVTKIADDLSGVYGANIQYQQDGNWHTLPTTVSGGTARAVIPADSPISKGPHALRVIVTDNADNQGVGYDTQAGTPAVLRYPVAAGLRLLYTVTPNGRRISGRVASTTDTNATLRLAYRQSALISGRLDSTARALLANQSVTITVRLADHRHYTASVRTNRSGAFRYRLVAGGDRTVKIAFAGNVGLRSASHVITVRNRAAIKLAAGPLVVDRPMTLTARVLGGAVPVHGLSLVAQWRRGPNSPWQTFPRLQTGANGRVSAQLAVPAVTPGSSIQLRVSSPSARGWGYVGAISSTINAKVA